MRRLVILAAIVAVLGGTAFSQDIPPLELEGDLTNGAVIAETCMNCHGSDGHSSRATTPNLAGQYEDYLKTHLWLFKTEQRINKTMNEIGADLDAQQIADVAAYWAAQPFQGKAWANLDPMLVELGNDFYASGGGGVTACARCHGDMGAGNPDRNTPRVWGAGPTYVTRALERYRLGGERTTSMHRVASKLTDADIVVLSAFLASQPWGGEVVDQAE